MLYTQQTSRNRNTKPTAKPHRQRHSTASHFESLYPYLQSLLENLADIEQCPRYHPEGNALYHSLQVFECSLKETTQAKLWAAALFHDAGKAIDYTKHAEIGAEALEGILHSDICWLIRHHLDLLTHPRKTRHRLRGSTALRNLERLRRWDLQGRQTDIQVITVQQALDRLAPHCQDIAATP